MTWNVPALVDRIVDGDTIVVIADLGWNVELKMFVRIDGINAPELDTPTGKKAKAYAQSLIKPGDSVTIRSKKLLGSTEKYGRTLADVLFGNPVVNFADEMLSSGHAKAWDGAGSPP